jgi:U4/U6 small nuclear ribonucleoprotein PRP3
LSILRLCDSFATSSSRNKLQAHKIFQMADESNDNGGSDKQQRRRKRRWGDATATTTAPPVVAAAPVAAAAAAAAPIDSKAKALALQESIRARLAALKQAQAGAAATTTTSVVAGVKRPAPISAPTSTSTLAAPTAKRAKHYELDMTVTGPTFKESTAPPKPKGNPYLAHLQQQQPDEGDGGTSTAAAAASTIDFATKELKPQEDELQVGVDDRVQASKVRKRHKAIQFIEPGTFVEIAERKRRKALNAEESGFVSGRKAGTYVSQQTIMANIYGSTGVDMEDDDDTTLLAVRVEANEKTSMPQVVEWWDMELLPSKLKKQVAGYEGKLLQQQMSQSNQLNTHHNLLESKQVDRQLQVLNDEEGQELQSKCLEQAALSYSKTAGLIQHIVPIKPPHVNDDDKPVEPTLYLTKKEMKRQRKLRRTEKQRELQDLQAAGLVEAPEPRLTLQNFIKVLGDQAFVDPSQMEQKVMAQMEARQRAHLQRNEAAKLTKEQRAAKLAAKLHEDTSKTGVHVALFYVKDLSHPYHRTKVDLNAQQNNITGGVVECQVPQLACVICEGGPKAIKRYIRLMTVRMKWKGVDNALDDDDEEDDDDDEKDGDAVRPKFNPENTCELVWTGMATKRFFKGFVFQACESGMEAAKILRAKGVGHFWDQILTHASGKSDRFQLKLGVDDNNSDGDDDEGHDEEEQQQQHQQGGHANMEED